MTVVAAFDSTNLLHVAKAYREQDPARPIIIAGDNDHHLPRREQPLPNTGVEKAKAAAKEVGGTVVVPAFEPTDTGTDWNDFGIKNGSDALRAALAKSLGDSGMKVSLQPLGSGQERSRVTQSQRDAARSEKQTAHGRKKPIHDRSATRRQSFGPTL